MWVNSPVPAGGARPMLHMYTNTDHHTCTFSLTKDVNFNLVTKYILDISLNSKAGNKNWHYM